MSQQLDLYEQGQILETLILQRHFSIYREYREGIHALFALLFLSLLILGARQGKVFSKPTSGDSEIILDPPSNFT